MIEVGKCYMKSFSMLDRIVLVKEIGKDNHVTGDIIDVDKKSVNILKNTQICITGYTKIGKAKAFDMMVGQ